MLQKDIDNLNSWEHKKLSDLAKALGTKKVDDYPSDHFDLIWTDPPKYKSLTVSSENCPGLDS
jgi:hypothetical protein